MTNYILVNMLNTLLFRVGGFKTSVSPFQFSKQFALITTVLVCLTQKNRVVSFIEHDAFQTALSQQKDGLNI